MDDIIADCFLTHSVH